jgi:polyhydroxyalkanoate synthesis regulator phasin
MNPDTLTQTLQKSFRVTLGATASLLDALKDPQGSQAKFSTIGTDVDRLTEELEARGADTEREARELVDTVMTQMPPIPNPFATTAPGDATVDAVATPVVDLSIQSDLEALTVELAALRQNLDAMQAGSNSDN